MFYVDLKDIIVIARESAIFGILMGIYSIALNVAIHTIENVILLPKKIYKSSDSISSVLRLKEHKFFYNPSKSRLKEWFFDFLYVLSYGILLIIFFYVATDGVFRLYITLIALSTTYLFSLFLGSRIKKLLLSLISVIYLSVTIILAFASLLIRKVSKSFMVLVMRLFKKIRFSGGEHLILKIFQKKKSCAK